MPKRAEQTPLWRKRLRRFFAHPMVEIMIGIMILFSVTLTLLEFWMEYHLTPGSTSGEMLDSISQPVTPFKLMLGESGLHHGTVSR